MGNLKSQWVKVISHQDPSGLAKIFCEQIKGLLKHVNAHYFTSIYAMRIKQNIVMLPECSFESKKVLR